ncbi:hypothetical protein [Lapillicoccus sp.]|jgi:hypothetical protein|uniref:hypothetical protein n=1 Tax=Lapillicoccus sp. TaxID=1909287 RepID=UPI0025EADD61|nr:hypothetical protein [Lapillicoccus sp.]
MFFLHAGPAQVLELFVRRRVDRARALGAAGDRGASAVEWVIITSVLVILVGIVSKVLYDKITSAAANITVTPPVPAAP